MLLRSLLSRLARLSAYKAFLQAPVAFRFFNPCPPFFLAATAYFAHNNTLYIEATHISTLPVHFFTRNRGGLPGSGATFDASLPSFHAATHFFAVCIALFIPVRGFYTKEYPASSLFYHEVKPFLSRAQLLFLTRQSLFCRDQKTRNSLRRASKPCFSHFSLNFSHPILGYSSFYSAISACQILPSPELFSFLRKKVCCVFGGNEILFYFCTRFPTPRR